MAFRDFEWRKIFKTVCLVGVWGCLGLFLEITGPTLIDLKIRTNSDYESVATAVSGRSAGFFIGAAFGGVLVDKLGAYCDLIVALSLDGGAIATLGVPWLSHTTPIYIMTLLQGTFEGLINVAGQKLIINMWKEKSASPLQILHGGFGIGSFLIPIIANPFLAVPAPEIEKNETATVQTVAMNYTIVQPDTEVQYLKESRIEYAYMVSASITALVSVIFYIYHISGIKERKERRENNEEKKDNDDQSNKKLSFREMFNPATCAGGRLFYGLVLFVLICMYFMQCAGGERVAGKFIRAFSIDHFGFSTDRGSFINTIYWLCFSAGRVSGFVVARLVPIRLLILLETFGCLTTSILMVIFAGSNETALWVLIGFLGFFTAPLFPVGIAWGNYHMEMTGVGITIFMMGGSIGGIIYMKLIGYLYDTYGPLSFLYTLLGFGILAFGLAVLMTLVGSIHGSRFQTEDAEVVTNGPHDEQYKMKAVSDHQHNDQYKTKEQEKAK